MSSEAACRTTHLQILAGKCPRCGTAIGVQAEADFPGELRWDIARMKADLNHGDHEVRITTIGNAGDHLADLTEAVNLIGTALSDSEEQVQQVATYTLSTLGARLSAEVVEDFEVA